MSALGSVGEAAQVAAAVIVIGGWLAVSAPTSWPVMRVRRWRLRRRSGSWAHENRSIRTINVWLGSLSTDPYGSCGSHYATVMHIDEAVDHALKCLFQIGRKTSVRETLRVFDGTLTCDVDIEFAGQKYNITAMRLVAGGQP
jgi:hypothetical protein